MPWRAPSRSSVHLPGRSASRRRSEPRSPVRFFAARPIREPLRRRRCALPEAAKAITPARSARVGPRRTRPCVPMHAPKIERPRNAIPDIQNMSNVTNKRAVLDTIVMILIMVLLFGGGYWIADYMAW